MSRSPSEEEIARWERWRAKAEQTISKGQALVLLATVGDKVQKKIENITRSKPAIVTTKDADIVNELGRRSKILQEQITGVLLRNYGIRFNPDGEISIVSLVKEFDPDDIYPIDNVNMGIAPIIIATAIAAGVLLIAGDQALDRLDKDLEIEKTRLQSRIIQADQDMAKQPPDVRSQWDSWKKSSMKTMKEMASQNPIAKGWLEKLLGETGSSVVLIGLLALGALAIFNRRK